MDGIEDVAEGVVHGAVTAVEEKLPVVPKFAYLTVGVITTGAGIVLAVLTGLTTGLVQAFLFIGTVTLSLYAWKELEDWLKKLREVQKPK